ncbi:MAG: thioredoxin [Dehalococcoidales bacterium]|jgi:thioredoxin 1|nr:thioredoxin [Dehalococcoidales bacterium]
MSKAKEVDVNSFEAAVLKADKPVLVDFWATWCKPCMMVAPIIDELAEEFDGKVEFVKVDVDANQKVAANYGVMSIPSLIIFKNGEPVSNMVGARPKAEIKKNLESAIA